jgi:hypothetical protein
MSQAIGNLRAEPDIEDENYNPRPEPISFEAQEHELVPEGSLDEKSRYLARLLLENDRTQSALVPDDMFASEAEFLKEFGKAVEALNASHPDRSRKIAVSIGLERRLGGEWIQFNPKAEAEI